MDTIAIERPQRDFLSSLPPELLLTIFDLAHDPRKPLIEPLSQRLLPYIRQNLYRQIHLSTLSSFTKLLRTVESNPPLGRLVSTLDASNVFFHKAQFEVRGEFYEIVRLFPRLISVNSGYVRPIRNSPQGLATISSLRHVAYGCKRPVPDDLDALSTPQLRSLEINFHEFSCPRPVEVEPLESVEELSICYVGVEDRIGEVWPSEIVHVVISCPKITSLRLFDPSFPDYRAFLSTLSTISHLALRLTSLRLDSTPLLDGYGFACDHLLPRFPNLTHLSLGDGTTSAALPTYLRQTRLLTSLRLGPCAHCSLEATNFLSLLEGPGRLASLRHLNLDWSEGQMGRRIDVGDSVEGFGYGSVIPSMIEEGWESPDVEPYEESDLRDLLRACQENSIEVSGVGANTIEILAAFEQERGNRTALVCYRNKNTYDLGFLDTPRHLFDLDSHRMDPETMELVKIEQPDKNWYILTLETVESVPAFGNLVDGLDTSAAFSNGELCDIQGDFNKIIRPFPRLVSAKLGNVRPLQDTIRGPSIPTLEHLCYTCESISTEDLEFLAQHQLRTLDIKFRSSEPSLHSPVACLPTVHTVGLTFDADTKDWSAGDVWNSTLVNIVDRCPKITSLRLFDPIFPNYRAFLSTILHLAHQITSLELDSPLLADSFDIACDDLLPQFSNLVHLSLGDGTISESLHSYLRQLPQLASLRLGPDTHLYIDPTDFLSLLEGPTRLPALQSLTHDCLGGKAGKRVEVGDEVQEEVSSGMKADGWERPRLDERLIEEPDPWAILRACQVSGIELAGDPTSAPQIKEDYNLEKANRSALRCLELKSIADVRTVYGSSRFPHIPISYLDPQNLKLVKTEIPEKNWFRLSLE